ncbi:hypothetical protein NA56DRAFT_706023 [Hyaloscypha hepaticicola]|uniref:Uncharacterized protein n=1 Tax=Hyaloscypha hepaticicola TaxID=2082293 RepID=A0A2J6PY73_9HELO|nr:hypothetical protein NA56DRAFT_706023 [Hyaloscypha hepaticicola]
MPRAIRKKATAPPKAERPATKALQPKSTNILKRSISNVYKGKGESQNAESCSKRVAKSSVDVGQKTQYSKPQWSIAGEYKITSVNQDIDTSGFSLKIFHYNNGHDHHLYATFVFDRLEGLMRMAPYEAMDTRPLGRFNLCDFEKACELEQDAEPVPRNESWVMRWRAKEGGMRMGALIDDRLNDSFTISMDEESTSKDFIGVKVAFDIIFSGRDFKFEAIKTENLETEAALTPQALSSKWESLKRPFQPPSDYDSSEDEAEELARLYSAAELRKMKQAMQSSSKLLPTLASPVLVPNGRGGMTKLIEALPSWAWDVEGEWKVEFPHLASVLGFDKKKPWTMEFQISNNPLHTRVGRQLWASLNFGDMRGTMRFCPMKKHLSDGPETLKKFESECVLPAGCWPGPPPKGQQKWILRWRGKIQGYVTSEGSDQHQSDCIFETAKDGSLSFSAVMMYDGQPLLLEAKKVKDAPLAKGSRVTVTTCWASDKPPSASRSGYYIVSI